MDLIAASAKEESKQHVHAWENVTLLKEEVVAVLEGKLVPDMRVEGIIQT
jgi:hypothetical protein